MSQNTRLMDRILAVDSLYDIISNNVQNIPEPLPHNCRPLLEETQRTHGHPSILHKYSTWYDSDVKLLKHGTRLAYTADTHPLGDKERARQFSMERPKDLAKLPYPF